LTSGGSSGLAPGTADRIRIPLPDNSFLAASRYLPAGAGPARPVPALLEALPYRKDDLTASYRPEYERFRDEHGYAVVRVDLRGTGSSPGLALDEYHPQEQADLHAVIGWLAEQDWCTGAVGMFGTSWSGFNALQLACERPPALRAVVATYATDDRWSDDVHYMGGALRLLDQVDYPLYMVAMNALPPVPAVFGDGWRAEWMRRIDGTPPWLLRWLAEPVDGPYWRHGSVRARRPARARRSCGRTP
jgi:predicted acyl esterase